MASRLSVLLWTALWYALNVAYNILNKRVLLAMPLPWTVALAQLGTGCLYLLAMQAAGLRSVQRPSSTGQMREMMPTATLHAVGHTCTVCSMCTGSVSLTHVLKAAEPVFAVGASLAITSSAGLSRAKAMALLLTVCGIALASAGEVSFSWPSFVTAMVSNAAFAMRSALSKRHLQRQRPATELFATLTFLSTGLLAIPTACAEGAQLRSALARLDPQMVGQLLLCGLSYYLYNEVAFVVLGMVHPVSQAVANAFKRVVVIGASAIAFRTPVTPLGVVGSLAAMAGIFLYSLAPGPAPTGKLEPKQH